MFDFENYEDRVSAFIVCSCNGMADTVTYLHCSLRFGSTFLAINIKYFVWTGFYVWEDVPAGGLLTGLYFFRYWSNSISGKGFIPRFLTRWVFTLPAYRFTYSDSS